MMRLFLEPIDVWLFRDGRPFDSGSDHRAESLFPPFPSVIQGAIRSHHLVVKGVDLRDPQAIAAAVGTATCYRDLRIRGPFLTRRDNDGAITRYLPAPADATTVCRGPNRWIKPASPPKDGKARLRASAPTPCLLGLDDKPVKGEAGGWLREDDLCRYLAGETVPVIEDEKLFQRESRLGIGMERGRRVAREGALYEVEFIRPQCGVGLYLEVEGYDGWPKDGALRLGGESHGAHFWQMKGVPGWPQAPDPLPERFKVYLATPTFFRDGWRPAEWERFFDGPVELVAAAVGRYQSIGGFDMATGGHKAAQRYVPAGSVYYFRCRDSKPAHLQPNLIQNAITDKGAEIGFGQVIIQEWKER